MADPQVPVEGSEEYFSGHAPGPFGAEGSEEFFKTLAPETVRAPEAKTRWSKLPEMYGRAAVGAAQNVLGLPGDVWDAANRTFPAPKPGEASPSLVIPPRTQPGQTPFFATSDEISRGSGIGLEQHPELKPVTPVERYGVAATEGAVGAAPALLTGGAAVPTLLTGAAGGMASQGASELAPGTALPLAAGVLAGVGSQGTLSLLAGNRIEKIASTFGQSRTVQEAGQALQDEARNWRNVVMPDKQKVLSAPLDARVPADAPVKLDNYAGILDSINDRAGDLQTSADVLTPAGARRLQAALRNRDEVNALAGKPAGEPTTWENARALRSVLGEAKSNPALVKDIGQNNIEALYAGISQDLGKTAHMLGAGDLWEEYNAGSTKLYKFAEKKLSKVISSDDPRFETIKPEDAASRLLAGAKRGSSDLTDLKAELPKGIDELTAAHLRQPVAWKNLSPEAKQTLVPNAAVRKELDRRMPHAVNALDSTRNLLGLGVGSVAGGSVVPLVLDALSSTVGPETAQHIGNVVGMTAPLLYQGGKAVVRNPRLMTLPAAGTLGAGSVNALSLDNK